jgi:hypothetical protein
VIKGESLKIGYYEGQPQYSFELQSRNKKKKKKHLETIQCKGIICVHDGMNQIIHNCKPNPTGNSKQEGFNMKTIKED